MEQTINSPVVQGVMFMRNRIAKWFVTLYKTLVNVGMLGFICLAQ